MTYHYVQVQLTTRTLNHVAVDNPRFQKQGYTGECCRASGARGLSGSALKFKKKF